MSAPDPVAALRKYVASIEGDIPTLDQCGVIEVAAAPWAVLRAAPALLAYVERLEAALVELAQMHDALPPIADEHPCPISWLQAIATVLALGREIAQRRKKGGRDVGTDL